jgi:hypothetical protein
MPPVGARVCSTWCSMGISRGFSAVNAAVHTATGRAARTEAQAEITRACPPFRDDFVHRDGPLERSW